MSESIYRAISWISARENETKETWIEELIKAPNLQYAISIVLIVVSILGGILGKILSLELIILISMISLILGYLGLLLSPFVLALYYRKDIAKFIRNPLSIIIDNAKKNHHADTMFVQYLNSRDNKALEISLIEMKAERAAFEKRVALIIGMIDKVGLLPGIVAIFVSLPKIKAIDIDWVLAIAYAMPFLYFLGLWSHFLMSKMSRHISLMEYALEQKKH